jgi:hypothetical protein
MLEWLASLFMHFINDVKLQDCHSLHIKLITLPLNIQHRCLLCLDYYTHIYKKRSLLGISMYTSPNQSKGYQVKTCVHITISRIK